MTARARLLTSRLRLHQLEDRATPAMLTVTSIMDSGAGSLREAVATANANNEADVISLDFPITGQTITLASPLDLTAAELTEISAPTASTLSGGKASRILNVAAGANVKVQAFTFLDGRGDNGGAIRNKGTLSLSGSVAFFGNQATADGGAISNEGTLRVEDIVFSDNSAAGKGGAITNVGATAVAVISGSTIGASEDTVAKTDRPGNSAADGGGIFNGSGAKLVVFNSTVHKNTATGTGGGVRNDSTKAATFTNCTIAFNTGGGLHTGTGGVSVANNTLFIGNTGGDITGVDLGASKNNLVGTAGMAGGLADGKNGNIVGVADAKTVLDDLNTQLATPFYPLAKNSPAIDKGSNKLAVDDAGTALANDQGGNSARIAPAGGTVDIGSREFVQLAPITLDGLPANLTTPQDTTAKGAFTTVVISTDTGTTPVLVTVAASKGTLVLPAMVTNVTNITGSGTGTVSFKSQNDGGILGALAVLDYVPPAGVTFTQAAGEMITFTATNTATNDMKTGKVPLIVGAVAAGTPVPVGFNFATPVDTVRTVTIVRNPASGNEVTAFQFTNIANGKLFADDKLTMEVTGGQSVPLPADAKGVPTQGFLTLFFQPTAGFTGAATFEARASAPAGQSDPLTTTIQVVASKLPIVPADNPGFVTFVGARQSGANAYDFTINYADDVGVDASKLGDSDLKVTARTGGFVGTVKFLGSTGNGKSVTATYRLTPPGGTWDAADNGSYVITLQANELFDTDGNVAPVQDLTGFDVSLAADPAGTPTAKLASAPTITAAGTKEYTFTVTYTDDTAIDGTSINSKDLIVVLGPNGYITSAEFVSVDKTGNGSPLTATYKITPGGGEFDSTANGTFTVLLSGSVLDDAKNAVTVGGLGTFAVNVPAVPPAVPRLVGVPLFAVGTDRGTVASVQFFNADKTPRLVDPLRPFGDFAGGVRTATADFNSDGVADLVVGTGPGRATRVVVLDGATQKELFALDAFEAAFTGGVYVSAGDLNGDGKADLVITPDEGGGPRVDVYSGAGFGKLASFFCFPDDPNFRGGCRPSLADVNGDGASDLVVSAGFGGGPRIATFDGKSVAAGSTAPARLFGDFFAFETDLRNGAFVTAGDLNGDGKADLIFGGGPGGGPRVTAFSGADLLNGNKQTVLANFFGGDVNSRGGIRVSVKDLDGDTRADIVVGAGAGAGSRATAYLGKNVQPAGVPAAAFDFDTTSGFTGGVFVG